MLRVGGGGSYRWRWGGEAGACTESLGSDSGDVGCDAAEIDRFFSPPAPDDDADDAGAVVCEADEEEEEEAPEKRRRGGGGGGGGGGGVGFPPAMARATGALFLRAERLAGRLILTEVRADERDRRVVFRAQRHAGRLRLRFASDDDDDDDAEAGGAGGVVAAAAGVQHGAGGGGGGGGGELCQVAAAAGPGRMGVDVVGAVLMGTTI